MTQTQLLDQLESDLRTNLELVRQQYANLDNATLLHRPDAPGTWNMVECFEHLNRSYAMYMPDIERAIHRSKAHRILAVGQDEIRYSGVGKRYIKKAAGANGKRYKTSKKLNPFQQDIPTSAVKSFIINSEKLLRLLQMSREVDLNRTRIKHTSLPFLSFRLANLLEYLTVHTLRHCQQVAQLQQAGKSF